MENVSVAQMLRRIADLLDYQGVAFKPAAYRRAAQTVEDLPKDIASIKEAKELKKLPGIGEAIAAKILEFVGTGKLKFLENLEAETQMGAAGLLAVDDLGPKRIREIEQKLSVRTVAELIEAAEKGKLRKLPRFSELLEKKILEGAKRAQTRSKRYQRAEVEDDVRSLLKALERIPKIKKAEAAGSFRRKKETVGDIDVLLAVKTKSDALAKKIADAIRKLPFVERIVAEGTTRIAFDLHSGIRVDVRVIGEATWGAALLYFTGSKEHNISLRRKAIEKGWKLSEYGLFKGEKVIAGKNEEEIYKKLGVPYAEPEKRVAELPAVP